MAQDAHKPPLLSIEVRGYTYTGMEIKQRIYRCPACGEFLGNRAEYIKNYCPECGNQLKPKSGYKE